MGITVGGQHIVGEVAGVNSTPQPVARSIHAIIAEQLEIKAAEEAEQRAEELHTLPIDDNRPIFNSLIDRKENSRYMLDLVKV
jgi:hypothetical protein